MRWVIISPRGRGEGGERIRAGARVSHAMGEGKQWGIMFRDFIRQAGQQWGWMERYGGGKGGEFPHAMTSGEGLKPLLWPPAQENQLSCMEHDRVGAMGARDKRTLWRGQGGTGVGQRDGQRDNAHGHPTPLVYPPTFCLARRSTGKNTPSRKFSRKSKRENALSLPCPVINTLFVSQNVARFRYSMISRYPPQNPDFT